VRVADSHGECIALVCSALNLAAKEHCDHLTNLLLAGPAIASDGLFHSGWWVFEDLKVLLCGSEEEYSSHMPQLQCRLRVFCKEDRFDGNDIRSACLDDGFESQMQGA
jgi:hypothetical protein